MALLYFSTGDDATDHNLRRLSHLASLDRFDGDAEQMHGWLIAVMDSIKMLPEVAAKYFTGYYFLGDAHFRMTAARRAEVWRELAAELRRHVDAAHTDPTLKRDGPAGPPDVSDRRETRAEQILDLCEKLEKASCGTAEFDGILARIDAIAVGDVGADVAELRRLSRRKRIPDYAKHRALIAHHTYHMRIVARNLHHLD